MQTLSAIKQAALDAMDTNDDSPGGASLLHSLMDPHTVLELVTIAETRISDEEILALHDVIAKMTDYIRRNTDDREGAALIRLGRLMVGATTR